MVCLLPHITIKTNKNIKKKKKKIEGQTTQILVETFRCHFVKIIKILDQISC